MIISLFPLRSTARLLFRLMPTIAAALPGVGMTYQHIALGGITTTFRLRDEAPQPVPASIAVDSYDN